MQEGQVGVHKSKEGQRMEQSFQGKSSASRFTPGQQCLFHPMFHLASLGRHQAQKAGHAGLDHWSDLNSGYGIMFQMKEKKHLH